MLDGQMRNLPRLLEPADDEFESKMPEYNSKEHWYSMEIKNPANARKNWVSKEVEESLEDLLEDCKLKVNKIKSIHSI